MMALPPARILLSVSLLSLWITSAIADEHVLTRSEFLKQLMKNYDSKVSPNFDDDDNPTVVETNLFIGSFDTVSEATMDYRITVFLRQSWTDPRLAFRKYNRTDEEITLDAKLIDSIWVPDLFFSNEKDASFHKVTVPNRLLRLTQDGRILHSIRISLTLSCPMQLHKFPLDTQVCAAQMESFGYTTERLMFKWKQPNPVEIAKSMELPQFDLLETILGDCTKYYSTGNFTCLQVNFVLKRDVGYYITQLYIPSILIVILSWISFWISVEAVPARISLGVLCVLTMTTQSSGARASLPRVSYVKAIDLWMSVCLLFVFGALLEYALVNVLVRKQVRRISTLQRRLTLKKEMQNKKAAVNFENGDDDGQIEKEMSEIFDRDPEGKRKARTVDKWARKLFPGSFFFFNVFYWIFYMFWTNHSINKVF